VLINSGNANACTGEAGERSVLESVEVASQTFGCRPEEVWTMSTGVIGRPMPAGIFAGLAHVQPEASSAAFTAAARAVMTTDTRAKGVVVEIALSSGSVRLAGFAKGAGMIDPTLATMLVWIGTDAVLSGDQADALLRAAVAESFHCISIDGDQSTNDTVLLQANGASEFGLANAEDRECFGAALTDLCQRLAIALVDDGEGATHLIEIEVSEALDDTSARRVARKIGGSSLVRTAIFGRDPNWGRIAAAAGAAEPLLDPDRLEISIGGSIVFQHGQPAPAQQLAQVSRAMQERRIAVHLTLGMGTAATRFWASDLTYDYVRINAEYTT